ncbi:MAG: hypothetical protein SH818_10305 [Saprospiraceae bacterium]|nr:hypothetical protein [Saprospiraceae bacterium]
MAKWISRACVLSLAGFILSGPVGFIQVKLWKPQPEWSQASAFVDHYHFLQDVPYSFSFLLLAATFTGHGTF